jgi:flagella basal body P-ring formation protein FlgA
MNTRYRSSGRLPAALSLVALLLTSSASAQEWQSPDSIRAVAESLVQDKTNVSGRITATADELDSRLKLPLCAEPLRASLPYAHAGRSRVTVEVACATPNPWRLFVPVALQAFGPVVVAARPLPRDTVLAAADMRIEEREIGQLSRGHIGELTHAVGLKLRRALPAGAAITPSVVATPVAIKRGQTVTVTAASKLISVAMTGTALEDGYLGEIIDITNDSSGRRVQAIVRSARVVEVLLN